MNNSPCGTPKARAFSLFEALATIAILGILSWVVVASQSGVSQHVARTKIESDIATINQAIRVYLANGGSLSGISGAQAVLDKLKTSISASEDAKFVGFGGTMIDPRLRARNTTNEESAASGKRAVWDATHLRFKLADSGEGIAEFFLDDGKGIHDYGTESRLADSPGIEYNNNSGWIWRYTDAPAQPRAAPLVVALGTPAPPSGSSASSSALPPPTRYQLLPPTFSLPAGAYAPSSFNLSLEIGNPNTSCSSWVMCSINGGSFVRHSGPLDVPPDAQVTAFVSGDSYLYYSSPSVGALYTAKPAQPLSAPSITPSRDQFLWGTAETILVSLTNPNDPKNSTLEYSLKGSAWAPYSQPLELAIQDNLSGASILARAIPLSIDYLPSPETGQAIQPPLPPTQLRAPAITASASSFMAGSVETISVTLTNPNATGSALEYRINGGSWVAYTSAFNVTRATYPTGLTIEARARATSAAYSDSDNASASVGLTPVQLKTPTITPSATSFSAGSVETISVSISNPNAANTGSVLEYCINGGTWQTYSAAFNVTLTAYPSGLTVGARARSTSPAYTNSASASQSIAVTPASPTSGGVAMIKTQATLDGQVFGSIQIQNPSTVNINSSTNVSGDINLPGTPKVTINGKPNFSGVAVGTGSTSPAGYAVFVNEGATFGVLRTRVDSPAMPSVNPPPATSGPWITVDSPAQVPASWFPNSGVNLNPNAGSITLPPGNYGTLNASNYANGGKLVLGNANGKPATYNFYSFTLNSGVPVQILGPVTINTREFAINAGSTLGSTGSQTLLTINVSGSQFIDNSSAKVYAKLILVPNGTLTVNGEVHAGVMAQNLNVTGSGRLYVGQ